MSKAKVGHTPGPWDLEDSGVDEAYVYFLDAGPAWIPCDVHSGPDNHDWANARLIAAAPDLLEALEAIEARVRVVIGAHAPELKHAREAIAKARGES